MPMPKIEDVRTLSDEELVEQIVAAKRELFELRFQKGTRSLENPHLFKHTRHRLAQLMTIERERQLLQLQDEEMPVAVESSTESKTDEVDEETGDEGQDSDA